MRFIDDYRREQLRQTELARFHRWFLRTAQGLAYVDRSGRPRKVSDAEHADWLAEAEARVEAIIGDANQKLGWALAGLVAAYVGGHLIFGALGIGGTARTIGIAVGAVLIEAGLIGVDLCDYWQGWRKLRDRIEAAVVARAPLAVDPERARIPRNCYHLGQFIVIAPFVLLYLYSHFDPRIVQWFRIEIFYGLALTVWILHFAVRRHDRLAQQRLTR
jgi:hypothetical protein